MYSSSNNEPTYFTFQIFKGELLEIDDPNRKMIDPSHKQLTCKDTIPRDNPLPKIEKKIDPVQLATYQIRTQIRDAWKAPNGSSGITATARFNLSSDGSVASVVITQSSGNDDFDASIKALNSLSGVHVPDDSEVFSQVRSTTITFKAP